MINNIIFGGPWIRLVRSLMYIYKQGEMVQRLSASSGVCYETMVENPRKIVTEKLRSYGVAHRELMPEVIHSTKQYENNRAEQSHEAIRVR